VNDTELAAWAEYNPLMARLMRDLYGMKPQKPEPMDEPIPGSDDLEGDDE
jgi:hypothetical protein